MSTSPSPIAALSEEALRAIEGWIAAGEQLSHATAEALFGEVRRLQKLAAAEREYRNALLRWQFVGSDGLIKVGPRKQVADAEDDLRAAGGEP